ncbi:MAG: thioredoxin [Rikenellaceae bacterium]|nr:thioredoxin [Rikenellaceae bacterium]
MKKLMLAAVAAFALAACGGRTGAQPSDAGIEVQDYGTTISLNKAEFLRKIVDYEANPGQWEFLGQRPAIIDFYADWCGPCRNIAPILESIAQDYHGQVDVYKINVDNEQELAAVFRIQSLPTVMFIPLEGQPRMLMGSRPPKEFINAVDTFLLNND